MKEMGETILEEIVQELEDHRKAIKDNTFCDQEPADPGNMFLGGPELEELGHA
jgi:hypothetical protein